MKIISNKEHVLIKPIFPMERLEVPNDAGYNSVKYDIHIDEYDVAIEVKCSRNSITGRTFEEEFGSEIYHYQTQNVYNKDKIIKNIDASIKSYTKNGNYFNKNIDAIVIHQKQAEGINQISSKQVQASKKNSYGNILDTFA
ncbi:hypothetical protein [Clostridium sp.]|jgi:hypothetical protein|uniref:PD-(D/E)XK nuclease domain-containing protein n=1 Tax=Clostridium sp. TaxID=1506 RepID=UPI00258C7956|nr:hypothetical protein [Clostridium sp.]MDF2505739.1 hypothetical protein [Clostridium sp.]